MRLGPFLLLILLAGCSRREDQRPFISARAPAEPAAAVVAQSDADSIALGAVALVELYTSEGCSSCPPADENLTRIAYLARDQKTPVIALSFHVDYWNYIGWKDPFSDAKYSQRQRRHARRLGSGVYTPQLVVGGREQLLGSGEAEADAAILRALARPASHGIEVQLTAPTRVGLRVTGPAQDAVVCAAVVQGANGIRVRTGENAGRTLSHVNIVRSLSREAVRVPGEATLTLSTPSDVDRSSAMVVVWVEDAETGHVLGAVAKSSLLVSAGP